jgi:hypothetical protein
MSLVLTICRRADPLKSASFLKHKCLPGIVRLEEEMCRKIYNETALANILKNYLWQNKLLSFPYTPVPYILTAHKMVDGHI